MDNGFHLGWSGPIIAVIVSVVGGTWAYLASRAFDRRRDREAGRQR